MCSHTYIIWQAPWMKPYYFGEVWYLEAHWRGLEKPLPKPWSWWAFCHKPVSVKRGNQSTLQLCRCSSLYMAWGLPLISVLQVTLSISWLASYGESSSLRKTPPPLRLSALCCTVSKGDKINVSRNNDLALNWFKTFHHKCHPVWYWWMPPGQP